jgi:hypothetical protein
MALRFLFVLSFVFCLDDSAKRQDMKGWREGDACMFLIPEPAHAFLLQYYPLFSEAAESYDLCLFFSCTTEKLIRDLP